MSRLIQLAEDLWIDPNMVSAIHFTERSKRLESGEYVTAPVTDIYIQGQTIPWRIDDLPYGEIVKRINDTREPDPWPISIQDPRSTNDRQ
jgi:hypothetical protein